MRQTASDDPSVVAKYS